MEILFEAVITSLAIIGIYGATSYELDKDGNPTEKNVLWFVRYYVDKIIGEPFGKPIILCPQCMASVWGLAFRFIVFRHSINSVHDIWFAVVFILIVSTLNRMILNTVER